MLVADLSHSDRYKDAQTGTTVLIASFRSLAKTLQWLHLHARTFWSVRNPEGTDYTDYTYSHASDVHNKDELSTNEPDYVAVPFWIADANVKSKKSCRPASICTNWNGQPREPDRDSIPGPFSP
jgi:hypothetical protein